MEHPPEMSIIFQETMVVFHTREKILRGEGKLREAKNGQEWCKHADLIHKKWDKCGIMRNTQFIETSWGNLI